tara:strand:- start:487 stop:810 length:324 start_codon:yes stop_codon:yes gene_type:complete
MTMTSEATQTDRNDRNDWREFFATFIVGESFIADRRNKASAMASAKRHGVRLKARMLPNGNFSCTILASDYGRQAIMDAFNSLPIERLRALHKAATQSGMFHPISTI